MNFKNLVVALFREQKQKISKTSENLSLWGVFLFIYYDNVFLLLGFIKYM